MRPDTSLRALHLRAVGGIAATDSSKPLSDARRTISDRRTLPKQGA